MTERWTRSLNNIDSVRGLLKDVDSNDNHWLGLPLVGGAKSPKDAIGATVYLTANGMTQRADVFSGGSYASTSDMRPYFGLGSATSVDRLEVRWPSALAEVFDVSAVDRFFTLRGPRTRAPKTAPKAETAVSAP